MTSFEESGLRPEILRAIAEMGFTTPTPVQAETLPLLHQPSTDLIALAQTGTGKTAGFGLPVLHQIDLDDKRTQAIILCPTRELCLQITKDFEAFSKYMPNLFVTAVYGGAPIGVQSRQLNKGSQIVVGTPGRVVDMISRGVLKLDNIQWFVLDEADEMLNMGFKDDLETVFKEMPDDKMTWLFSATMPVRVESITKKYMKDPMRISIGKRNEGAANISHDYYMVSAKDRFEALSRIIDMHPEFYGVIFCRTRIETTDIAQKLARKGYPAQALNGDMSQAQRDQVMGNFRKGNLKLLVATDVAARGLDVDDLTHVINFNLPDDLEVYVHRSGRTGRAGKSGSSITIVHGREGGRIRDLEKITGKKFNLQQVPTGAEIGRLHVVKQTEELLDADVKASTMGPLPAEIHLLFEGLSREQIIDQWIQWSFRQNVREDANNSDINVSAGKSSPRDRNDRFERSDRGDRGDRRSGDTGRRTSRDGERRSERPSFERSSERPATDRGTERRRGERDQVRARDFDRPVKRNDNENFVEIEVNIGATQDMKPNRIMGLINEVTGDSSIKFGRIDIKDEKSFIGVEADYAKYVAKALDGLQFGSRKLKASFSDGPPKRRSEGGFERRSESGSDRRSEGGYERRSQGSSDRRSAGGYEKPKYDKPKYEERKSSRKEGFDKKPRRRRL
jgi:ATP-dependent RNA helicase DeaD